MKINLERKNDAVHFVCTNERGNEVHLDGSASIGGEGKGASPMETVLMAVAGCSSIDIVSLLKKMRQPLEDLKVEVEGIRHEDRIPKTFKKINIHFIVTGDLDETKVEKAVRMSMETYCSVSKMLEKAAEISWSFDIVK